MNETYGKFDVDVWSGGHPVWCHLAYGGVVMRIDHRDLRDLEYAVRRMLRKAEDSLPENYKHEVAP